VLAVTVETIEEGPHRIRLRARIPGRTPSQVFQDWIDPGRIHAWWGPEATVDLREGGEYVFRWVKIGATLRGKYRRIEPPRRLEFSWAWDDDPDRPKEVSLQFRPSEDAGTLLEVTHEPYSADPRDQELKRDHLEGWRFHLPKLGAHSES
jgi:uncharacterized protein YndB with AHSA1/START domain